MTETTSNGSSDDSAPQCPIPEQPLSREQQELSKIIQGMKSDPKGIFHIASDGVYRSLTADRDVIDAVRLPRRLIKALCDSFPFEQMVEDNLRGADGTNATEEQMYHPDMSILPPPPLTPEEKDEADRFYEENKVKIEENRAKRARLELKRCPVVVRADYDLGPKK